MLRLVNDIMWTKGLMMKKGTVVDATLIAAPSSTKNADGQRDPEMHQTRKGKQWHFGVKAHIGADADSGLVHSAIGIAGNVGDVMQAGGLLHGEERVVVADAGYRGVANRAEAQGPEWHVAMCPGQRKRLNPFIGAQFEALTLERCKASVRAKVEHPFRVLKRQFDYTKV